jgi:hypothetical protein
VGSTFNGCAWSIPKRKISRWRGSLYEGTPRIREIVSEKLALLVLRTIYGLVQAALAFWRETVAAFAYMKYIRSKADPCLHFKWTETGLIIWISWVDDFLVCGNVKDVLEAKAMMGQIFDCEDAGIMNEYVGCKITRDLDEPSLRMTQPVLLQSFEDEFDLS